MQKYAHLNRDVKKWGHSYNIKKMGQSYTVSWKRGAYRISGSAEKRAI